MELREKAIRGLDLSGLLIIDSHTHLGVHTPGNPSARNMIHLMDEVGIRKCVNSSWVALFSDCAIGNGMVHQAMQEVPDRIIGLCVINPHYPDEIVPEMEKRMTQGFVGAKIEPFLSKYSADGRNYHLLYEYANQHSLIVKVHTYKDGNPGNYVNHPELLDDIAAKYRNVRFILAHAGGAPAGFEESIRLARKHENIYLEVGSTLLFTSFWLKKILDGVGSDDRICYGSDSVIYDPRPALGEVLYAKIPDASKEKILGLNMDKLLKR